MHLTPDRLTLLALGDSLPTTAEVAHLTACAACRREQAELAHIAAVGRRTRFLPALETPPQSMWQAIAELTSVDQGSASAALRRSSIRRALPRLQRRAVLAGIAAVAVLVVVAGVVGRVWPERTDVAASTDLAAYGTTPTSAHGSALIERRRDGLRLRLRVAELPPDPGYHEVWLIDPDNSQMIAVGVFGTQSEVSFPLPSTVDLVRYRLVDVSAEPDDGNPAHSGDSLLRGSLRQ